MGTDDLFKKRRAKRKARKAETKAPKINSYLIVTEGKQTEPNYFKGLKKLIMEKTGGTVDIVPMPQIDIEGQGCSTMALLDVTDRLVNKANIIYQNIWVVFDKDDFTDFDGAITEAEKRGYKVAWSNQSFEYWLYLHFYYSDSALHRHQWNEKLKEIFRMYSLEDGYEKNYEDIFDLVNRYDGMNTAINNAKRRMSGFDAAHTKPSAYDPGTTVHVLVDELRQYINE